jgi:hypothetical protein
MLKHLLALSALPVALMAQQLPTIRLLNAPEASTEPIFGLPAAVRQLPNGHLLVNDVMKRQLLMFDQSLANETVVADSLSGGANSYGTRPGGIIPYLGDSTLFVDPAGLTMFVLDPSGKIARVASVPRSQDAMFIASNIGGVPGLDAKGRIVYRGGMNMRVMGGPPPANGAARTGPGFQMPDPPDTAAIVRIDPVTRKLDTAGFYKIPKTKVNMTQTDKGMSISTEINPMPLVDDWAVVSDGSIAVLRGRDYHVDWIDPDGSVTASPKVPFDWQRLSDEDKIAIIDSAKAEFEKARTSPANAAAMSRAEGMVAGMAAGMAAGGGARVMTFGGGGAEGQRITIGGRGGAAQTDFVNPSELPDYRPPFTPNALRADMDGNLWVRTTATRSGAIGGPVYDVISRKGELIDRIQVPVGRTIIGFGSGGVVYLSARDERGTWIERAKR